jgi:hypothetical protein
MQLATKSKGQRDDITVIVIDALPAEDMRLPPMLQAKKSGSTMIARYVTLTLLQEQLGQPMRVLTFLREGAISLGIQNLRDRACIGARAATRKVPTLSALAGVLQ